MGSSLQTTIDAAWERRSELSSQTAPAEVLDAVASAIAELDAGRLRVAEKADGKWITHQWLKKAVLLSLRGRRRRDHRGEFGVGHGSLHQPEHEDLRPFDRPDQLRPRAGRFGRRRRQPAVERRELPPVLRSDRQAGRRQDARQNQHQRSPAKLKRMSVSLKSADDVAKMRVAGTLASEVLDYIAPHVTAGVTTGEIDRLCHAYMVDVQHTVPA